MDGTCASIGDLAVECLGVDDIESLDVHVRVATNFVKMMMKKIARNKFCNFDSTNLFSLAFFRRMVFALFCHSSEKGNFVFLVLVEDL